MANTRGEGHEQLSVHFDPALRSKVEEAARREQRSISGQIRFLVVKGLEAQQPAQGEAA